MLNVTEYPRPRADTGIGFRLDVAECATDRVARWLGETTDMGGTWLVVPATLDYPVADEAIRSIVNAGVEPVIHQVDAPIRAIDRGTWRELLASDAGSGARYVCAFAEPNLANRWTGEGWSGPGLVQRLVDHLVAFLESSAE